MQVKNTKDENKQTDRRTPDSITIPYRIHGVIYLSRMWFGNSGGERKKFYEVIVNALQQ